LSASASVDFIALTDLARIKGELADCPIPYALNLVAHRSSDRLQADLAAEEANTQPEFKRMIVDCSAKDIMLTNCFTGVSASFLRPSIEANGLDPAKLFRPEGSGVNIAGGGSDRRAWRDIWSAGQGIGAIKRSGPARNYIDWLVGDDARARTALGLAPHG
jgi:hypothetical protein